MKIALLGASGNAGSRILAEALARGHHVTGVVRHPEKLTPRANLTALRCDANDLDNLAPLLAGHDAVISAIKFGSMDLHILISAVKKVAIKRLLLVGGAGSLKMPDGGRFVDVPGFPAASKEEALIGCEFLDILRSEHDLGWTFLSPSMLFLPGERTGKFRYGKDDLLFDANGRSGISMEDFALAMLDELETPRYLRQRFTVGY